MGEFTMPSLGADMEHGKVVEWLVKPGDYVHRGDLVAEVDTDKTVMDVESFEEGVVAEFLVDIGDTVPVGTPIARITATPDDGAATAAAARPGGHRRQSRVRNQPLRRFLRRSGTSRTSSAWTRRASAGRASTARSPGPTSNAAASRQSAACT